MSARSVGCFCLLLFGLQSVGFADGKPAPGDIPHDMQAFLDLRTAQLQAGVPSTGLRSDATREAMANWFSQAAIRDKASALNVSVSDDEAAAFLKPLLIRQGLIDARRDVDIRRDPNVASWLAAQKWTAGELVETGRTLLLWVKIAARDVTVTPAEVEAYVAKHPDVAAVPARLRVTLTHLDRRGVTVRGGLPQGSQLAALLTGAPGSTARDTGSAASPSPTRLALYLDLERIDPNLRKDLAGKKSGDAFGPVELTNDATVAGVLEEVVPTMSLAGSIEFSNYAALLTRLHKANQEDLYRQISSEYFATISNPGVKRLFKEIYGFVGGAIGAVYGVPVVGGAVGGMVGGWMDGEVADNKGFQVDPRLVQGNRGRPLPPPSSGAPAYASPAPMPISNMPPPANAWMGGAVPSFSPRIYNNYPPMPQAPMMIPPMPSYYAGYSYGYGYGYGFAPAYTPAFYPPIGYPMPVWRY
jgi:hypothetical protein